MYIFLSESGWGGGIDEHGNQAANNVTRSQLFPWALTSNEQKKVREKKKKANRQPPPQTLPFLTAVSLMIMTNG